MILSFDNRLWLVQGLSSLLNKADNLSKYKVMVKITGYLYGQAYERWPFPHEAQHLSGSTRLP